MKYVLGFAFNMDKTKVALIHKERSSWTGWNGLGGHIENLDATYEHAMSREFREEAGVVLFPDRWTHQATIYRNLGSNRFECWVYSAVLSDMEFAGIRTMTDEEVSTFLVGDVGHLQKPDNLMHLIGICLDKDLELPVVIDYKPEP